VAKHGEEEAMQIVTKGLRAYREALVAKHGKDEAGMIMTAGLRAYRKELVATHGEGEAVQIVTKGLLAYRKKLVAEHGKDEATKITTEGLRAYHGLPEEYLSYEGFINWLVDMDCLSSVEFTAIKLANRRPPQVPANPFKYCADAGWRSWPEACALANAKTVRCRDPLGKKRKADDDKWEKRCKELRSYGQDNGKWNVPVSEETNVLRKWLKKQRVDNKNGKLTSERQTRLGELVVLGAWGVVQYPCPP
jgi:hypothetical protein